MSEHDGNSSAAALGIQSNLDLPVQGDKIYDKSIYVSGWVYCEGKDPESCRVCAYVDGAYVGETRVLAGRVDVYQALKLQRGAATAFRIIGRMESSGTEARDGTLRVTASWEDGIEHVLMERSIQIVPALLRSRPYGEVVYPENEKQLHRENIYGSGPPLEDPGAETALLLNEYLPDGASVVDIGCGAGAYGPGLLGMGHEWLGLEANTFCCEILQRRQLPFRKVELESASLPCADGEWDCAICVEVLEHVQDPESFISEIVRMTRRRTLFSVPNMEVLPYLHDWGVVPWHLLEGDHKNFFTRGNLRALLSRYYRKVEVFPYGEHPLRTRAEIPVHVHLFAVADK
jgi:SAM-dependent methyltransferase